MGSRYLILIVVTLVIVLVGTLFIFSNSSDSNSFISKIQQQKSNAQIELGSLPTNSEHTLTLKKFQGLEKWLVSNKEWYVSNQNVHINLTINTTVYNFMVDAVANPTMEKCLKAEPYIQEDKPNFDCSNENHRTILLNTLTNFTTKGMRVIKGGINRGYVNKVGNTIGIVIPYNILVSGEEIEIGENSIVYQITTFSTADSLDTNVTQENNFTHLTVSDVAPYDSLVLYMPFDVENKSDGIMYDWSGEDNDATIVNDAFFNSSGMYGGAMDFNDASDYMNVAHDESIDFNISDAFTLSAFVKVKDGDENAIFHKMQTAERDGYWFKVDSNSEIALYLRDTNGFLIKNGNTAIDDNEWHHVVAEYNGSNTINSIKIYVDGVLDSSAGGTASGTIQSLNNTQTLRIGTKSSVVYYMNGTLDELMIFNTSLTAQQILDIYNNQSARFKTTGKQEFKQFNMSLDNDWLKVTEDDESLMSSSLTKRVGAWEVSDGYNDTEDGVGYTLDDGLVGYWHLDNLSEFGENSTHVYDFSGNGYNGTIDNDAIPSTTGYFNSSYEFDGANDGIIVSGMSASVSVSDESTLIAWVKNDDTSASADRFMIDDTNGELEMYWGSGTERFNCRLDTVDSIAQIASTDSGYTDQEWRMVTCRYNSTTLSVWVNGIEDTNDMEPATGNVETVGDFRLGDDFDGHIDEVMIFNRSLSAEEIKSIYIKGRANYQYTSYQPATSEWFNVGSTSTNFLLDYNFTAGNGTEVSSNSFYSPILKTSSIFPLNITDTVSPGDVGGCGELATPGTYNLISDVSSTGTCFTVMAENVTINCGGYEINYSYGGTLGYGVYSDQFNTTVKNCNIVEGESGTSNKHAIYFNSVDADNGTIENNNITTIGVDRDSYGIYMKGDYCTINNNNLFTNAYGIYLFNADYHVVDNNIIMTSGSASDGLYLSKSLENVVKNNYIDTSGNGAEGIRLYNRAHRNTFINNTAFSQGFGVIFSSDLQDNIFINQNVTTKGSNNYGVYVTGGLTNVTFIDSTINAPLGFDLYVTSVDAGSFLKFINVSFNKSSVNIIDEDFELDVGYYLDVNVTDAGVGVDGALVNGTQVNTTEVFSELTNSTGWIVRQNITEYTQNWTGEENKTYWTNYSLNVTADTLDQFDLSFNFTDNLQIDVEMSAGVPPDNSPVVNLIFPTNTTSSDSVTTYSFNATITDDINITNATFYIWNETGLVNTTEWLGIVEETEYGANSTFTLPRFGNYTWNYLAYDNSTDGNSAWNSTNYTLEYFETPDTTNPFINITFPSINNTNTTLTDYNVNYTASDTNLDTCWWRVNEGAVSMLADCTTNLTGETWKEGLNLVEIYANDTSNNINSSNITFRLDTTAPDITILLPLNHTNSSNNNLHINYTFVDTGVGVETCWWTNDTGAVNTTLANCGVNITEETWTDGGHNVTIYINDTLNNVNSSIVFFTIDTITPDILIVAPTNNSNTTDVDIYVNYTFSETNPDTCWWTKDEGSTNTTLASCGTNITDTWTEGLNNITVYINDTFNNVNSSFVRFRLDTTPPSFNHQLTNQEITENQNLLYDINATDIGVGLSGFIINDTYSLFEIGFINGSIINSSSLSGQAGEYYFNVSVNDTLGNKNTSILLVNVTAVDTTSPNINLTHPTNTTYTTQEIDINILRLMIT